MSVSDKKSSYTFEDLIECAKGRLFGPGNAQLPLPPMLMMDRIIKIAETGGLCRVCASRLASVFCGRSRIRPTIWPVPGR